MVYDHKIHRLLYSYTMTISIIQRILYSYNMYKL